MTGQSLMASGRVPKMKSTCFTGIYSVTSRGNALPVAIQQTERRKELGGAGEGSGIASGALPDLVEPEVDRVGVNLQAAGGLFDVEAALREYPDRAEQITLGARSMRTRDPFGNQAKRGVVGAVNQELHEIDFGKMYQRTIGTGQFQRRARLGQSVRKRRDFALVQSDADARFEAGAAQVPGQPRRRVVIAIRDQDNLVVSQTYELAGDRRWQHLFEQPDH